MLSHPALFTHPALGRVGIIGGGDCGTLREAPPGDVEQVTQIDIDERVTRLAVRDFPELTEANGDDRARLLFDDGIALAMAQAIPWAPGPDHRRQHGPGGACSGTLHLRGSSRAVLVHSRPAGFVVQQSV